MAFLNLSFETADGSHVGCADGWVFSSHASAFTYAPYDASEEPWEDFEEEWLSNQNYLFALSAVTRADYQTLDPAPKQVEDFEEFWSTNHTYVYGIAGTLASYDGTPEDFEDFEEEWDSNEGYLYELADGPFTLASYDVAPEDYEDFAEDWDSNESYLFAFVGVGTDLTAAVYTVNDVGSDVESFEGGTLDGWSIINTV
jgi:hypothetical protein